MNAEQFPVTSEDIARFEQDGVVMLKCVLSDDWLSELERAVADTLNEPGRHHVDWVNDAATGDHIFYDASLVNGRPGFMRYMTMSPVGPIAAALMRRTTALAFYLSVFVRSSGTGSRTPWHQDQPYWCASGPCALSVWTSLDPVPAGTELEFVRGSHLWDRPLELAHFEQENLGGALEQQYEDFTPIEGIANADEKSFEILKWCMEPGDVLVFHGMTVHGGSGSLPNGLGRRSVSAQWLGLDSRLTDRLAGCNPDLLPEFDAIGLHPGDSLQSILCPSVSIDGRVELFGNTS